MAGYVWVRENIVMASPLYLSIDGATLNQVYCALQDGAALQSDKVHQIKVIIQNQIFSVKLRQRSSTSSRLPHPPCLQCDELGQWAGKEATVAEAEAAVHRVGSQLQGLRGKGLRIKV